jgi:hypothetical protein
VLAIKITTTTTKPDDKPKDTLSLLVLDQTELTSPDTRDMRLLKLRCKDTQIHDFMWHPLGNMTLVALVKENLEIWNLNDEDFLKPSKLINLRLLAAKAKGNF